MVFPAFLNLSLNLAIRSSWSEPQSAPGLVLADCIELFHLWLQRIYSIWFGYWPSGDVHVQSLLLCYWKRVFAMTSVFSWQNSISLSPASFCTPGSNLPVTPGISWVPTFAFQPSVMKRISFLGDSSRRSCRWGLHRTIQLRLLHYRKKVLCVLLDYYYFSVTSDCQLSGKNRDKTIYKCSVKM